MTSLASISATALLVYVSGCAALLTPPAQPEQSAQTVQAAEKAKPAVHAKKSEPKPEPSQQELFDYIRGKLIALSPNDGINDNQEVTFDPATSILSITQADGRCDIFLSAIDSNSAIWEVFDPSDTYHTREELLRVTLTSLNGKKARTCYDSHNEVDTGLAPNRARLVFSLEKSNAVPKFSENMGKAIKKLVVLAGGVPEKSLF
jgi:hypothetical protein